LKSHASHCHPEQSHAELFESSQPQVNSNHESKQKSREKQLYHAVLPLLEKGGNNILLVHLAVFADHPEQQLLVIIVPFRSAFISCPPAFRIKVF